MAIPTPGRIFTWIQHSPLQQRGAIVKGLGCPPNHRASLERMLEWLVQQEYVETVQEGRSTKYEVIRTDIDPNHLDKEYESEPPERPPQIELSSRIELNDNKLPPVTNLPNPAPPTERWDAEVAEPEVPEPAPRLQPTSSADSPRVAELLARVARLETEATKKDAALAHMRETVAAERQRTNSSLSVANNALSATNLALRQELELVRRRFTTMAEQLIAAERARHDAERQCTAAKQELSGLRQKTRKRKEVTLPQETKDQLLFLWPLLVLMLDGLNQQVVALQHERDFAITDAARQVAETEELYALTEAEAANLRNEKKMWVEADPNPKLQAEVERLKAQVKSLGEQLRHEKQLLSALNNEIEVEWAQPHDALDQENERLKEEINKLLKVIEVLQMHRVLVSGVLTCGHKYGLSVPKAHNVMPGCNRIQVVEHLS